MHFIKIILEKKEDDTCMQETNEKTLLQMIDGGGLDWAMTVRQRDVQRLGHC